MNRTNTYSRLLCLASLTLAWLLSEVNCSFGDGVRITSLSPTPHDHFGVLRFKPDALNPLSITIAGTIHLPKDGFKIEDAKLDVVNSGRTSIEITPDPKGGFSAQISIAKVSGNQELWNRKLVLRVSATVVGPMQASGIGNTQAKTPVSIEIPIQIDSLPPNIVNPIIVDRDPGGSGVLKIRLEEDDLKASALLASSFSVFQDVSDQDHRSHLIPAYFEGKPTLDRTRNEIILNFRNLNPGNHWLAVGVIQDEVGNSTPPLVAGSFNPVTTHKDHKLLFKFTAPGGRQIGTQVEFPRFLQPGNIQSEFVPGDRVDTRTIQLYYFRDARRVAELINRNIRALNQTGYDDEHRFARQARVLAENAIDDRRYQETLAVEAARRTREIENQIDQLQNELEQSLAAQDQLAVEQAQLSAVIDSENSEPVSPIEDGSVTPAPVSSISLDAEINETRGKISEINLLIKRGEELTAAANESATVSRYDAATRLAREKKLELDILAIQLQNERDKGANADPVKVASLENQVAQQKVELETATAAVTAINGQLDAIELAHASLPELRGDLVHYSNKLQSLLTLQARNTLNQEQQTRIQTKVTTLTNQINQRRGELNDVQNIEITERNDLVRAEATELRTAEERFRREVAAGLTDPDVFVPGKVASVDPVTQVSISVVGTSRIHLRGPVKGINKIARMIHQLDTPVGQVKVGIHTVQVNGEHGDRMDFVYERIHREIQHSRFLVNLSGQLLRRAVHEVAAEVAMAVERGYLPDGCPPELSTGMVSINGNGINTSQELRNRRYVYAFFGSDFISELEEMDSELLNTENKMLSLNSMDTISLAGALTVTALSDHPVRARILQRYQELVGFDLPEAEVKYVNSLTHVTKRGKSLKGRFRKAMHLDAKDAEEIYFNASRTYHFPNTVAFFNHQIPGEGTLNPVQYATIKMAQTLKAQLIAEMEYKNLVLERSLIEKRSGETEANYNTAVEDLERSLRQEENEIRTTQQTIKDSLQTLVLSVDNNTYPNAKAEFLRRLNQFNPQKLPLETVEKIVTNLSSTKISNDRFFAKQAVAELSKLVGIGNTSDESGDLYQVLYGKAADTNSPHWSTFLQLRRQIRNHAALNSKLRVALDNKNILEQRLYSQRLLELFMDEQEEKSVELMEALRAHSSNVDNYLKRIAIAMEDDVSAQFYEPAFQRIRRVSRSWDVTLGQIETTTVLTNNRTLAKVDPTATFEFDLPPRDILVNEAFAGAEALAKDYGNLLNDGTFLAGTALLSTQPAAGIVGDNSPMKVVPGFDPQPQFGSNLQQLIPEPAIYKFETGTGFEIRPVIQPDGNSIIYTFDYLYSTNVREPVRADEKHLGRVKRHFVHTDVQTSSYELREISKYTVALKASRTSRGVPGLEDVPFVGGLFRPLPSDESSLQTNIILGSSVIYPTVFDLMGLRWSQYVDEMSSPLLVEEKVEQANRRTELRDHLLLRTKGIVNEHIGLPNSRPPSRRIIRTGPELFPQQP